jgi:hypothetical protein
MAKIIPITEHFQHFLREMKESFWGDLYGQTRQAWQQFFELQSERQRDRFSGWGRYERRRGKRRDYRNGPFSEVRADLRLADDPSAIRSTPLFPL